MNSILNVTKPLRWSMAVLLVTAVAGCDGIVGDPVLGGGGVGEAGTILGAPTGSITPGTVCTAGAGATIPTVTMSNPTSGNQFVTTSTSGVAGNGKSVTATFSLAMDAATINTTTFTLAPTGDAVLTPASVSYNAATQVATLTTSSALLADTSYTAMITQGATSATSVPVACIYAWNFKTTTPAAIGAAPVNLGLATPFGIAATGGITNTTTTPISTINGNAVLDPDTTCNFVAVDAAGGFGLCGSNGSTPTINGTVISPLYPDAGATSGAIKADLLAAYLSITPPAGPPAAGSLGGATNIPSGTTLGEPTGSALVQGDNLFTPGVYQSLTSILITGDLTLDAQGDSNAVFIFQSSSTVGASAGAATPDPHTRILLINGAKASNVFWQAGSSATLGTYAEFQGNILAAANVTMETGATSCGRLLAGAFSAGAFVLDANVVSVPGNTNAPLDCQ